MGMLYKFYTLKRIKVFFELILDKRVTPKRAANLFLVFLSKYLRLKKPLGKPYHIMIEPTNICNLKCPICPTGNGTLLRSKGFMTFETFKKIVDDIGDCLLSITLMNYGEPFLNKDIFKMISYANKHNISVVTCTNGHYFEKKEQARALIESGMSMIMIAVDGLDQETYTKYRINGDLSRVLAGIKNVVEARKELKAKKPIIKMQFIVMKHNEHQLEDAKKLAKDLGVDALEIKAAWVNNREEAEQYLPSDKKWVVWDLVEVPEEQRKKRFGGIKWRVPIKPGCGKLWNSSLVNWDGSVGPCCWDMMGQHKFGNINHEGGFKKVWENKAYQNMRTAIWKNRDKLPICSNCPGETDISREEKLDFTAEA